MHCASACRHCGAVVASCLGRAETSTWNNAAQALPAEAPLLLLSSSCWSSAGSAGAPPGSPALAAVGRAADDSYAALAGRGCPAVRSSLLHRKTHTAKASSSCQLTGVTPTADPRNYPGARKHTSNQGRKSPGARVLGAATCITATNVGLAWPAAALPGMHAAQVTPLQGSEFVASCSIMARDEDSCQVAALQQRCCINTAPVEPNLKWTIFGQHTREQHLHVGQAREQHLHVGHLPHCIWSSPANYGTWGRGLGNLPWPAASCAPLGASASCLGHLTGAMHYSAQQCHLNLCS